MVLPWSSQVQPAGLPGLGSLKKITIYFDDVPTENPPLLSCFIFGFISIIFHKPSIKTPSINGKPPFSYLLSHFSVYHVWSTDKEKKNRLFLPNWVQHGAVIGQEWWYFMCSNFIRPKMVDTLRGCLENLLGNHMTLIYTSFKQIHTYIHIYNII